MFIDFRLCVFYSPRKVCEWRVSLSQIDSESDSQVAFSIAAEGSAVDVRDFSHKDDHMVFP